MMMLALLVAMIMVTVSAALRLKTGLHVCKIRSKAVKHILNHMIGPNTKNVVSDFCWQMTVSEMPRDAHEAREIPMPDLHKRFSSGSDLQPSAVIELQAISMLDRNCLGQIEKHIFPLVCVQSNAAAMASIKIKRDCAQCFFLWPMPGPTMY
jgi:hypothetical protein